MALAPVTAVFLGQIGYGRSVREFMVMNLFLPALFSALWMGIFSGSTLYFETKMGGQLFEAIKVKGAEAGSFGLLQQLPLAAVLIPVFVLTSYFSFVSGADANTTAMAAMSQAGISQEAPEPKKWPQNRMGFADGFHRVAHGEFE